MFFDVCCLVHTVKLSEFFDTGGGYSKDEAEGGRPGEGE